MMDFLGQKNAKRLLILGLLIFFSLGVFCSQGFAFAVNPDEFSLYKSGPFNFYYATKGKHTFDLSDFNKNGVPDKVEDIAIQMEAGRDLFTRVLGFPDPFKPRFYPDVKEAEIVLLNKETMGEFSGLTTSVPQQSVMKAKGWFWQVRLVNLIEASRGATPVHEYFHLIQNSVSHVSNLWYFEGLARWAEDALFMFKYDDELRKHGIGLELTNEAFLKDIFAESYDAVKKLWYPLVLQDESQMRLPLGPEDPLYNMRYIATGGIVLRDLQLPGAQKILAFMDKMPAVEKSIMDKYQYPRWFQDTKRNPLNNRALMLAIRDVFIAQPSQAIAQP